MTEMSGQGMRTVEIYSCSRADLPKALQPKLGAKACYAEEFSGTAPAPGQVISGRLENRPVTTCVAGPLRVGAGVARR